MHYDKMHHGETLRAIIGFVSRIPFYCLPIFSSGTYVRHSVNRTFGHHAIVIINSIKLISYSIMTPAVQIAYYMKSFFA